MFDDGNWEDWNGWIVPIEEVSKPFDDDFTSSIWSLLFSRVLFEISLILCRQLFDPDAFIISGCIMSAFYLHSLFGYFPRVPSLETELDRLEL